MSHALISIILESDKDIYPLTFNRSVSAIPVAGKYRLVDIPISNCLHAGIARMFVLTQFNAASLNRHIKNTYHFSSFSQAFVDILSAEQTPENTEWYKGTADAVRKCLRHIRLFKTDYILILPADQFYQMDFSSLLEYHISLNADVTIATHLVKKMVANNHRIFNFDQEGFITGYTDYTGNIENMIQVEHDRGLAASMGIYIFNRDVLFELLENSDRTANDFRAHIIPLAIAKYKVAGFRFEGYCASINNIHSFHLANLALTEMNLSFHLFDQNKSIYTRQRWLPPAKINKAAFYNTLICEGSIIDKSYLERSIIGIRSRIGAGSRIINSYIMGNDTFETPINSYTFNMQPLMGVGQNCRLNNVIMDKNVRMGNDVFIEIDSNFPDTQHELFLSKDGIAVTREGVTIPDGFNIDNL